jgi:hypothetical protein
MPIDEPLASLLSDVGLTPRGEEVVKRDDTERPAD